MKHVLLSKLRDKDLPMGYFRAVSTQLGTILVNEAAALLDKKEVNIQTPMSDCKGISFKNQVVLIPILRSGLVLLPPFLRYFTDATIGCVGMKRDEETAIPNLYYKNLPTITDQDDVIVLDPMIATGGSGSAALQILIDDGVKEEKIIFVAIIASCKGVEQLQSSFPKIRIIVVEKDEKLNDKKFIVPGLGDFGDRFFGTL